MKDEDILKQIYSHVQPEKPKGEEKKMRSMLVIDQDMNIKNIDVEFVLEQSQLFREGQLNPNTAMAYAIEALLKHFGEL